MTSSRSSLGLGRQMIFHSDARHGKPTRHHGHWKFQKLHGENLWISMGSHWWKFHSHVRINNINNIYILYINITMISTDCSIFPRRPEDRSRSPHGVDTLRCTSREIPETPRNARHSDAFGRPGTPWDARCASSAGSSCL